MVFTITMVDLSTTYGVILGQEWSFPLGGYIMNDGHCMMFPTKDGIFTNVLQEPKRPKYFEKK